MNIGGVGAPIPADTVSGASPLTGGRFEGQLQSVMSDMTGVLAMSPQQLNVSLSQAGSLSSVAAGKGISEQQLVSTIKQGLQDAGSKLNGARLDNIATRIARHRAVGVKAAAPSVADQVSSTTLSPNTWQPIAPTTGSPSA